MPNSNIVKSFYRESMDFSALCSHQILRAGHIKTEPDYKISRESVVGHEFIYCVSGAGWVVFEGKKHYVHRGQLTWLPVTHNHTHYPDKKHPWEIYWFRAEGGKLDKIMEFLQVLHQPVFLCEDTERVCRAFEEIFDHMQDHSLLSDIHCDKLMSEFLAMLLEIRSNSDKITQDPIKHKGLSSLIYKIHSHYSEEWDVDRFVEHCQVSRTQLFRLFKATFNESPLKWLKNYRITQARRMLVETDHCVSEIAYLVGYKDPLHFSRDFKATTGICPSEFRREEKI